MGRMYLLLMGFLGMFGCLASNLSSFGGPGAGMGGAARNAADSGIAVAGMGTEDRAASLTEGEDGAIVLDREEDGHFYAEVEINGTPIDMMVDTGASSIALSAADARQAGIATTIGMAEHIGEGAGGAVYGDIIKIDRIRLGDTEARDLDGVVLRGGDMSLLGQSFLRRFESVEISGDQMILR